MSTYSWSYKTASHRQVSVKRAETDEESQETCPDKSNTCHSETDRKLTNIPISQHNSTVATGTAKRLNWKAKIYVGNLNKKTNEVSLAYYFSVFGDIDDIKLIRDHQTKESRGFAFITFEKIESAEKAKKWCSFNYPTLDDNSITVASAERKTHKMKPVKNELLAKRHPSQTLFWEFKWKDSVDAEVYGPYETNLMQAWKNQGYFDRGCWVRQVLHRQVCRPEESQKDNAVVSAGNDKADANCEPSAAKKAKLVMDYSDSEEEDEDSGEKCGEGVNTGERLRIEDGDKREEAGNNEMMGDTAGSVQGMDKRGLAEGYRTVGGGDDERGEKGESGNSVMVEDTEGCEDRNEETVKRTTAEECGLHSGERLGDERKESGDNVMVEDTRGRESFRKNEVGDGEKEEENEEGGNKKETSSTNDVEKDKNREEKTEWKESGKDGEGFPARNADHSPAERKQNDRTGGNTLPQHGVERQADDEKNESSLNTHDILQLYEQGPSNVPENCEPEANINDADVRLSDDYSSSEEEDLDNSAEDISTEFVAISEIDFNLYP